MHLAHIVCVQGTADTKLSVLGWIASISNQSKFWIFHVVQRNDAARVTEHADFTALPTEMQILCPRSDSSLPVCQNFNTSHFSLVHKGWPFQDYRHFLIEQVVTKSALNLGSLLGASCIEMIRLGNLDGCTICSIRKLFSHLIKATFYQTYKTLCLLHLSNVRDLAFLPKLMDIELQWKEIELHSVRELLQLSSDRFQVLCCNPQLIRDEYQEGLKAGRNLLNYRLSVQQDLPTRLKHLYSWNLNSWGIAEPPLKDPKTRRCRRLLKTGPVCLQETKWDNGIPEKLAGYLPGTRIFSTPGALLDSGKRSAGVAVLLPPGWKAEKIHELVPSKALAVLVRDRLTCFYLVSVYLRPDSKKRDLEKLMQEWARLDKVTARAIFVGDYNRVDEVDPTLWNSFLACTGCLDVDPKLITYSSQTVASALDRCYTH